MQRTKLDRWILVALGACFALPLTARADEPSVADAGPREEEPARLPGSLDANAYYDTRGFGTLTLNTLAILPRGFSYFGFVDYTTDVGPGQRGDTNAFYTEQNLQWGRYATSPVELHLQWGLGASVDFDLPDVVRVGVRLHPRPMGAVGRAFERIHFTTMLTFFPLVQSVRVARPTAWDSQVSLYYRIEPFADRIDHRIYVSGWADVDLRTGDGMLSVMTEHQLGLRLAGEFYAVGELRYASFQAQKFGVGLGLEFRVRFETPTRSP